jgi:predicted nucleic acid-binding protein
MQLCADSCCIINLLNGGALGVLASPDKPIAFQGLVEDELERHKGDLEPLLKAGAIVLISGDEIFASEVGAIAEKHNIGAGEAECIVVGNKLGMSVATDDSKARSAVQSELGKDRVIGSLGILKNAVLAGKIDSSDAYSIYEKMKATGAFLPSIDKAFFDS